MVDLNFYCAICLKDMVSGTEYTTCCGHTFHKNCVPENAPLRISNCLLCNGTIVQEQITKYHELLDKQVASQSDADRVIMHQRTERQNAAKEAIVQVVELQRRFDKFKPQIEAKKRAEQEQDQDDWVIV
jgi:hypothetical protein